MTKFLLLGLAAAIATPALAAAAQPLDFVRDGEHFVGYYHDDATGRHIEGRSLTTGADFSLTVVAGKVEGTYEGSNVSFDQPGIAQTASR